MLFWPNCRPYPCKSTGCCFRRPCFRRYQMEKLNNSACGCCTLWLWSCFILLPIHASFGGHFRFIHSVLEKFIISLSFHWKQNQWFPRTIPYHTILSQWKGTIIQPFSTCIRTSCTYPFRSCTSYRRRTLDGSINPFPDLIFVV